MTTKGPPIDISVRPERTISAVVNLHKWIEIWAKHYMQLLTSFLDHQLFGTREIVALFFFL